MTSRPAPGPRGLPLLGSLPGYRRNAVQFFSRLQAEYGDVVGIRLGPFPVFLVSHPDGVRHVISANDRNYGRGRFYENFKLFFGRGLLTTDGEEWKSHRRVTQPAFLRQVIASSGPHVVAATEDMLFRWRVSARAGDPVDALHESMQLTLGSLSRTLFGIDVSPNSEPVQAALDFGLGAMYNSGSPTDALPSWVPTPRNRGIARHRRVLRAMVDRIIAEHREQEATVDLVALLERAAADDPGAWSAQDLQDEVSTIFLAGQETTAMALCWLLYLVGGHPEVRERLRAEVDAVPDDDLAAAGEEGRLPYTRAVIDETLRLYPPVWLYPRDAIGDDEIGGYRVPAGSSVIVSPWVTHRRPDLWDRPEEFRPERFLGAERRHRFAYFPFGGGPRQCIGSHMALQELQIMLAMIVREFHWELQGPSTLEVGARMISLRPVQGMTIRVVERVARQSARAGT